MKEEREREISIYLSIMKEEREGGRENEGRDNKGGENEG
jgi:hypothetical protein